MGVGPSGPDGMSFSLLSSLLLCSIAETEIASAGLVPSGACRGYPWWLLDMVNSVMTGRARSGEVPWPPSCPRDRPGPQDPPAWLTGNQNPTEACGRGRGRVSPASDGQPGLGRGGGARYSWSGGFVGGLGGAG